MASTTPTTRICDVCHEKQATSRSRYQEDEPYLYVCDQVCSDQFWSERIHQAPTIDAELKRSTAKANDAKRLRDVGRAGVIFFLHAPCDRQEGIRFPRKRDPLEEVRELRSRVVAREFLPFTHTKYPMETGIRYLLSLSEQEYRMAVSETTRVVQAALNAVPPRPPSGTQGLVCPKKTSKSLTEYNQAVSELHYFLIDLIYTWMIVYNNQELDGLARRIGDNLAGVYEQMMAQGREYGLGFESVMPFLRAYLTGS